jgi:WD40 repeat protein
VALGYSWEPRQFTENSLYVATVTGMIRIIRFSPGKIIVDSLFAHDHLVSALGVSRDGKMLVSGDELGTIKIWNLANIKGLPITIHAFTVLVNDIVISNDNRWIAVSGADGGAKVYCLDRKILAAAARQYSGRSLTEEEKKRFGVE